MHIVPINVILSLALLFYACDALCTTYRVLYDGDRLHDSTLPYYPYCRYITFIRLDVLCLVDSHP
jgi:hypothetical protein